MKSVFPEDYVLFWTLAGTKLYIAMANEDLEKFTSKPHSSTATLHVEASLIYQHDEHRLRLCMCPTRGHGDV